MEGDREEEEERDDELLPRGVVVHHAPVDQREAEPPLGLEEEEDPDHGEHDGGPGRHADGHAAPQDHGGGDDRAEEEEREKSVDARQVGQQADDEDVEDELADRQRAQAHPGPRQDQVDQVEQTGAEQRVVGRRGARIGPADQQDREDPGHRDGQAAEHQPLEAGLQLLPIRRSGRPQRHRASTCSTRSLGS